MILITGASGMLGSYVSESFRDHKLYSLGRGPQNDFICDLRHVVPEFKEQKFNLVVHCAGTEDDNQASSLNIDGTLNLLRGLETSPPVNFVFISSYKVYSADAGENVNEDTPLWASSEAGRTKAVAEEKVRKWAGANNVNLTIIRPARMFGNKVSGETLRLFNDAVKGNYIHIRGNDSRISLVTALDVAQAIVKVYEKGGIYNATDGRNPKLLEMMEALTANAGAQKRMIHLPPAWAEWFWRLGRFIPVIKNNLSPEVVEQRLKTLTLDGTRLAETTSMNFFDTIKVIKGTSPFYPYSYRQNNSLGLKASQNNRLEPEIKTESEVREQIEKNES